VLSRWTKLAAAILAAQLFAPAAHASIPSAADLALAPRALPELAPASIEASPEPESCGVFCQRLEVRLEAGLFGGGNPSLLALDAWGNYRNSSELEASKNRFGFTGHLFDRETGTYYAKARYFDPGLGRFLSQDSYLGEIDAPSSLHRYAYGWNRPTFWADPTGHAPGDYKGFRFDDDLRPVYDYDFQEAVTVTASLSRDEERQAFVTSVDAHTKAYGTEAVRAWKTGAAATVVGLGTAATVGRVLAPRLAAVVTDAVAGGTAGGVNAIQHGADAEQTFEEVKAGAFFGVLGGGLVRAASSKGGPLTLEEGLRGPVARPSVPEPGPDAPSAETVAKLTYRHQIKPGKLTDIAELESQIASTQVERMNQIIQQEGIAGLKARILRYRADPSIEAAGRAQVEKLPPAGCTECGDPLAWLHGPDMAVGGGPGDVVGKGLLRNNSILGGQANRIADEILKLPSTVNRIEWELAVKPARVKAKQ
jgi:RHS repeat-associated protein